MSVESFVERIYRGCERLEALASSLSDSFGFAKGQISVAVAGGELNADAVEKTHAAMRFLALNIRGESTKVTIDRKNSILRVNLDDKVTVEAFAEKLAEAAGFPVHINEYYPGARDALTIKQQSADLIVEAPAVPENG